MAHTVISSATREVIIGDDRPFAIIGERINPTGRKILAAEMAARRLLPRGARCPRAGRGRRPHARCQRRDPPRRRAGDPRPDRPAGPVAHGPAAVHRFVHRGRARGRPRGLPGQGTGELGHRRGRAPGARPAARPQVRRRRRGHLQRRDRDLHGPRRPVRGGEEDRGTRGGPRDPTRGHRGGPAGHADRRGLDRRPWRLPAPGPAAGRAGRQHDLRRVQRELRAAEPRGRQRRLPRDGDRERPHVRDHEPDRRGREACR